MIKNIAIIGFGNIAEKHAEVFRSLGCNIIASANRSAEKRNAAIEYGITAVYEDFHEMIAKHQPDGIIVCVSYWNMYEVLCEVIPYGIPILAEKPSGTNISEHLNLCSLAEKHGTQVLVGLNRRHYNVLQQSLELLGGREKITNVLLEWSENPTHLKTNRNLTDEQIGKQIFGNTIHGLDLLVYLAGNISNPLIHVKKTDQQFGYLMNLSGVSNNGVLYNFNSSWDNPVPWRIVIYSTGKRLVFAPLEQCEFTNGKEKHLITADEFDTQFKAGFYKQAQLFLASTFSENNLQSATNSMQLAEEITQSLNNSFN